MTQDPRGQEMPSTRPCSQRGPARVQHRPTQEGVHLLHIVWPHRPPSFTGLTTRRASSRDRRGEVHLTSQTAIVEDRSLAREGAPVPCKIVYGPGGWNSSVMMTAWSVRRSAAAAAAGRADRITGRVVGGDDPPRVHPAVATGLSALHHGARVLVVERRARPSTVPRATGISIRTMETARSRPGAAPPRPAPARGGPAGRRPGTRGSRPGSPGPVAR